MDKPVLPSALVPYSHAQMDNFYQAFAAGKIKATSVMNYLQHLFIAQRCQPGDWVLDVGCGRALQVPILKHVMPTIAGYVGFDISWENLQEASQVILSGDGLPPLFPVEFIQGDASSELTKCHRLFDVVIYTSALEHMGKEAGIASLQQVAHVFQPQGTFYLSTPHTSKTSLKKLQHPHAHVYEWDGEELEEELTKCGFAVSACYGLLSSEPSLMTTALHTRFGSGAVAWFEALQQVVPSPFLDPFCAAVLPEVATERLYVCHQQARDVEVHQSNMQEGKKECRSRECFVA